jgi:epoxyqueuosine reductase QueG
MRGPGAARLATEIKRLAGHSTADLIGIAPGSAFGQEELGELGASFGPVRAVVVLAQHIVDPVQMVRFFSGVAHGESRVATSFADSLLLHACYAVTRLLEKAGRRAAIPRNLHYGEEGLDHRISYKKAGVLAGLGALGRNQLLIHPEWGPWMSLRAVITDAPLPPGRRLDFSPCDDCGDCLAACPCGALSATGIDREACRANVGFAMQSPHVTRLSPHAQVNCHECMRGCRVGAAPPRLGGSL